MQRRLTATAVALSATALIMGIGPASATPTDPTIPATDPATSAETAAPAAPATITLPLFGAPLTVEITAGPGGVLASVAVNPADGLTATTLKPNRVVFVNEEGTAKVVVNARGGNQKIEARAGSLAEVTGPGGWSGDLFGTGAITTVGFEIVALADGSPDITTITTSDPTAEIGTVEHEADDDGDGDQEAKVRIRFTDGTQSRTLSIKVEAEVNSDGTTEAKVKLALSNVKGVSLPAAEVAGAHTWNGVLCNGAAAQVSYTVAEDGSLSAVTATPEPERMHVNDSKIQVRFTRHERVNIRVRGDDGELKISVDEKIRCHDAPPPSVNTEVAPDAVRPDDDDGRDRDRDRDGNNDGHRGEGNRGDEGRDENRDEDDDDGNRGGNGNHGGNGGGNGNGGGRDGHRGGDD